jgi:glucose/arabinose dehydrogenase
MVCLQPGMRFKNILAAAACLTNLVYASTAFAQLRAVPYVSGLSLPVAFVQDPADATIQYVLEQGGRIRLIRSGALQATPFLDLTSSISSGGERGLLGMALPADYATSGRFFVNFTNPNGDTVVARFRRSASNPLVADASSRVDFLWSTGERVIRQPYSNHNGGSLVFGPDGYLYIGTGDGGSANDPEHRAQNMTSLLGKMLRIDVSVPDSNAAGFVVPPDNPFRGSGAPEIWSIGLRNPWKFSFDDPARGGTGAMVIADVGQGAWEEIDYEPAGRSGVNYGWRLREGAHNNVTSLPAAFQPLVDPIFEYDHSVGQSITGGYVYRGTALGSTFRGRYFYGDFVAGRVWSIALTVNASTGVAAASDLREHTSELSSGSVSTFGVDAAGELYVVNYGTGTIARIASTAPTPPPVPAPPPTPFLQLDTPSNNAVLRQPFAVAGWALDAAATTSSGISAVHVYAYPAAGSPVFLGSAQMGGARPDVAAFFGSQFGQSGFGLTARGLTAGSYTLVAFGLITSTGAFGVVQSVPVRVAASSLLAVDTPGNNSTVSRPFAVGGWAIDASAATGTGIDAIHVWAYPVAPAAGSPVFVGTGSFGDRSDVASIYGAQFRTSGYNVVASSLPAGTWDLVVFAHSSVSGAFDAVQVIRVTVR